MNHPLNSRRYADLVDSLSYILSKIDRYIEVSIELKKLQIEEIKSKVKPTP